MKLLTIAWCHFNVRYRACKMCMCFLCCKENKPYIHSLWPICCRVAGAAVQTAQIIELNPGGQLHDASSGVSLHKGLLSRSLSDPSPRACLPWETLPEANHSTRLRWLVKRKKKQNIQDVSDLTVLLRKPLKRIHAHVYIWSSEPGGGRGTGNENVLYFTSYIIVILYSIYGERKGPLVSEGSAMGKWTAVRYWLKPRHDWVNRNLLLKFETYIAITGLFGIFEVNLKGNC